MYLIKMTKSNHIFSCPFCKGGLMFQRQGIECLRCHQLFSIKDGIIFFAPREKSLVDWDELYKTSIKGNKTENLREHIAFEKRLIDNQYRDNYLPALKLIGPRRHFIFLEVGCGIATFALQLKNIYPEAEIVLLDKSLEALRTAQAIFRHFKKEAIFVYGDAFQLPFRDQGIDLVYSGGLLEHFRGKEQRKIGQEMKRVAKVVICQVPIVSFGYYFLRILITLANRLRWPFGWERPLSNQQIKKVFQPFSLVKTEYHDFLTAWRFRMKEKIAKKKNIFNKILKTEAIFLFRFAGRPKKL